MTLSHSFARPPRSLLLAAGVAAALFAVGPAAASAQASAEQGASADLVNIQTATAEELQTLPGIGPSRADAIVAQRERRAFRRIEDLMRVRGVGRATFRQLRSRLTVGDAPAGRRTRAARR